MSNKDLREKAFDSFIDGNAYEKISSMLWDLVKAAFNAGWEQSRKFYETKDED